MFTPGQIQRSYQATIPLVRNSNHLVLDNIQINSKSKWDQPIQIPPVLYYKFNVPLPEYFKQIKLYPKSLLDYIKRAYEKCKDQSQKLLMEKSLRDVVRNFENDLNQVNWETYPIPQIKQDATASKIVKNEEKVVAHPVRSRLNEIRLPSSYNIVQQQKPSKALQIAKKRMQKLQKKINRQVQQGEQQKKQKVMGFSMNPPQIKVPRFNMNSIQSFPPPPPPPSLSSNLFQSNNSLQRFSQISSKNQSSLPSKNSSMIPTILKVEIDTKPIQKFKQKIKEKQKQRQKQKQKQKQRQRQKQRQKQKQKQRLKQKQRQRLKEKEKEKEKLKQRESNKKQSGKKQAVRENEAGVGKISKKELGLLQKLKEKNENINQIARRFQDFNKLKSDNYQIDAVENSDDSLDFQQVITGKNQSIEKPYLRITGRPNPDTVRPEPVLIKALKHFLEKYKKDKNYEYLISQLRSIRQDLTVQHIKNQFTVHVYQENLQISLYEKDIPQFKHCQTTLWQLYSQGHFYTRQSRDRYVAHQMVTLIMEEKSQEMEFMMTRIPDSTLANPIIQDCLKLKRQLILGNYTGFFNFFSKQDKFVKCLFDLYIDKMMVKFLLMICRTCGEKVPIKQLCKYVGQYEAKLDEIIKTQNGVTQDGFLMLKASYDQLLKSEHLLTKKVTVLLS